MVLIVLKAVCVCLCVWAVEADSREPDKCMIEWCHGGGGVSRLQQMWGFCL